MRIVAQRLMGYFATPRPSAMAGSFPDLAERERTVVMLLAQGSTNPAIVERLVRSVKTLRDYVSSILSKLQVAGRAEAIIKARDAG